MFKWSTFKNFLKFSFFVTFATMVTYFAIDLIQEKNKIIEGIKGKQGYFEGGSAFSAGK